MRHVSFGWLLVLVSCAAAGGCAVEPDTGLSVFGDRDKGLVIILPGIQGNGSINEDIRQALAEGTMGQFIRECISQREGEGENSEKKEVR